MDGIGKPMALVTDTFSDHVVSETADTKGTPAVSDVVLCVNRSTVNGRPRKLTAEQVNQLVADYNKGATKLSLSRKYQIARSTVHRYLAERTRG